MVTNEKQHVGNIVNNVDKIFGNVDHFSLSPAHITPSSSVNASQFGGRFQINVSLITPLPLIKMCGIFSNSWSYHRVLVNN